MLKDSVRMLPKAVMDDPVIQARTKGIGILKKQDAIDMGFLARSQGHPGLRSISGRTSLMPLTTKSRFDKIVMKDGDVYSKTVVRLLEMFGISEDNKGLPQEDAEGTHRQRSARDRHRRRDRHARSSPRRVLPLRAIERRRIIPNATR